MISNSLTKRRSLVFFPYLALLSMLGFLATDMYLPAFNQIESSLNASASLVAMTLTCFLGGLAIGQLAYGSLCDRFGKRNTLMAGLGLFALSSVMLGFTENISVFFMLRVIQAFGACSAAVIWQALVMERFDEGEARRVFSSIMPLVALSPALAPLMGAWVSEQYGWRAIFIILAIVGLLLAAVTPVLAKESRVRKQAEPVPVGKILKNSAFQNNVAIFGACSAAFFCYLTLWPAVMQHHGYAAAEIGLSFIPQTLAFMLGGFACKKALNSYSPQVIKNMLITGFVVLSLVLFLLTQLGSGIQAVLWVFAALAAINGAVYPLLVTDALAPFSSNATKAAGWQNFIQLGMAFIASAAVAMIAHWFEKAIGAGILMCAAIVMLAWWRMNSATWRSSWCFPDPSRVALGRVSSEREKDLPAKSNSRE
ncbi:purine nucleoside transporter PunC [Shewanella sp. FJAT-52076]|uniref:purine nucleoside transporter PunC n=1 Tax=Shewanella sp. FJAT-52076 TaxID=2864202 RepID=UPI0021ACF7A9|nr:purine nucleoside transporter PunC [Shewanella sp. FJAT-52076]